MSILTALSVALSIVAFICVILLQKKAKQVEQRLSDIEKNLKKEEQ